MATDAWPHIGCLPVHHQAAQKDTIFAEKAQRLKMKDWRDVKHFATGLSFDLILTSCIWANLQSHTHIFCRGKYCGKYQRLLWTIANVLLVSAVTQNISWAGFYCWLLVFLGVGSHFYGESKNALYAYFDPYLPAILQNLAKQQQEVESTALGKSHEKKLTSLGDALLRKLDQPSSWQRYFSVSKKIIQGPHSASHTLILSWCASSWRLQIALLRVFCIYL